MAEQLRKPAGFFGRIISNMLEKGNKPLYDKLIDYMAVQPGERLFEIGYGPGVGINLIMNKFDSCTIHGIDFSELMTIKAKQKNLKFINDNKVLLEFGDFLDADIKTGGFDKVYFANVIYFWDDIQKPFIKIYSLLRNGGSLFFYMAGKEYLEKHKHTNNDIFNKYAIEQVAETLKTAGFKNIDWSFDKGYYIKAVK